MLPYRLPVGVVGDAKQYNRSPAVFSGLRFPPSSLIPRLPVSAGTCRRADQLRRHRQRQSRSALHQATAAANIQDAVDAAQNGDTVLVSNGVYETGGRVTPGCSLPNRVVITNSILVKSVNGPLVTAIKGRGPLGNNAVRCAFVTNGILDGFMLTNGYTRTSGSNYDFSGGGAFALGGTLANCILSGNSAQSRGGGVCYGTLRNCALIGNSTVGSGGGACASTMYNCSLANNSASQYIGGGAYGGVLNNCVLYYNKAPLGPNYLEARLSYCCTLPRPEGIGNITNEPFFVSSYHIASSSPCVGAGSSAFASGFDIDGEIWVTSRSRLREVLTTVCQEDRGEVFHSEELA